MGNSKLKWSPEEEKALREGVNKHGVSKWKIILKDPQFHHILSSRSNIDLKDKWRNMNHAKSRLKPKPKPKPSIQDQKSTEAGRLKMEKEEKVSSSSEEMEEGILAELIAELGNTNNDPEHEQYCKDLELLLQDDENADEILAYANQIMDPPFDNYDFSDL